MVRRRDEGSQSVIRHHVLMKFTDPDDAPEALRRLEALTGEIPTVLSLEAGVDVLGGEVSWDLALVTTHPDLEGLQAYQVHPAHAEFGAWVRPRLAQRATVDVEV
jgi:hypothetical protein